MVKPILNEEGTEVVAVEITVNENVYTVDLQLNVIGYSINRTESLERTII